MDVFVGRQAILDGRLQTHAYELLFRSGLVNGFDGTGDAEATSRVMVNTFLGMGTEPVLGGKPGFINFPRSLLLDETWKILPKDFVVIEILESIEPDKEVVEACRKLKKKGYKFALDDFVSTKGYAELLDIADYVKVDFRLTDRAVQRELGRDLSRRGIRMLAEKIETREEYAVARGMGYTLFQGYFFTRPVVVTGRDVTGTKSGYLNMMRALQKPELDLREMEALILKDLSLTHKLLRYVNSALFSRRTSTTNIRDAIVALGEDELRRWLLLMILAQLAVGQPPEAVTISLARARFCEAVAGKTGNGPRRPDYFLMGLFSLLDLMLGRPLDAALRELKLPEDVTASLLGAQPKTHASRTYALAQACEAAESKPIRDSAKLVALEPAAAAELYADAVAWSDRTMGEMIAA